jgi:hypothetical protein
MEYRIILPPARPEPPARFEAALLEADPAAVFDVDPSHVVRVATTLGMADLTALLRAQGEAFADVRVEALPSICCGGCSG